MNIALLVGTITSEIRRIDMPQGGSVTKFRLKTVEKRRTDGEMREWSQTHLIDCWSPYLQQEITPYLREGQMVQVTGAIESRNVAKQGEPDRWTTTIVLRGSGNITVYGGPGSDTSVTADANEGEVRVDHRRPTTTKPDPIPDDDGLGDIPF